MINTFIRQQRVKNNLTRKQMANSLKIGEDAYAKKEMGQRRFNAEEYMVLANTFNLTIEEILMGGK